MRDEDVGCETTSDNPHKICTQPSFNARCAESNSATNASDGVDWAVGTMVWTLFDYYGEPPVGGPEVSGTYGQFDLVGFPKAAAFWYRTQWLLTTPDDDAKPFATNGSHEVHLVESWESPNSFPQTKGNKTRTIHAYSSAPTIELFVNDKSQSVKNVTTMLQGPGSYAEWIDVPWEAGNLTAIARDASGNAVAWDTRLTNGEPTALRISLDSPNKITGTGSSLFADGQDAALVRVSVVDASGSVVHLADNNVSFVVISGPGFVQGTHNGDTHRHTSNASPWSTAFHGLVRAVVRVTDTSGIEAGIRDVAARVDVDGPLSSLPPRKTSAPPEPIVVEASSPGLGFVRVSIPVSADASAAVLAVAEAAGGGFVDFFGK